MNAQVRLEPAAVRILIVDDQYAIRTLLCKLLGYRGYRCTVAGSAEQALLLLRSHPFELMLSDVNMPPGQSGIELIERVQGEFPAIATIMVTAEDNSALAEKAINMGIYGYVIKPFHASQLTIAISNALHRRRLEIENRAHRELLEQAVAERTQELRNALAQLQVADQTLRLAHEETINRLMRAAEFRDNETAQHIVRMGRYCEMLARAAGMPDEFCDRIRHASPMHDIGKIGTPDHILLKSGPLSTDEMEIMKQHAEIGYRILQGTGVPILETGAIIAHTHHEKFDGSGYPRGLSGEAIPFEGRLTAVTDVFDALISRRVYKDPFPVGKSVDFMRSQSGAHFDPFLLEVFLDNLDAALAIKREFPDD